MYAIQVVVAESSNARFYNTGNRPKSLVMTETIASPKARGHEQELRSSRPGRLVNRGLGHTVSLNTRHSAREIELDRFARQIARRIGGLGREAPESGLVLIAGSRLLGLISKHLSVISNKRLVATLAKDLFQIDRSALEVKVAMLLKGAPAPAQRKDIGRTSQAIRRR
jgi:protein required for attachment to host cells